MPTPPASRLLALAPTLSLAVLAAACGGKGKGGGFAAPTDVSTDLLTRDHDAQRAVIVRDGVAYLYVRGNGSGSEGTDPEIELPSCWTSGEEPADSCARTAPVPADT